MGNLADTIEGHIRRLLEAAQQGTLELQRHELARQFDCVPSQINYVLTTRFTAARGYMVESRRGGGGFIRIVRVSLQPHETLARSVLQLVGDSATQRHMEGLLIRLVDEGMMTETDSVRIRSTIARELAGAPEPWRDQLRARVLRALLWIVLGGD